MPEGLSALPDPGQEEYGNPSPGESLSPEGSTLSDLLIVEQQGFPAALGGQPV